MSPRMTINTSEALSFEPAQPGPYSMKIDKAEPQESKEKKSPGVQITFVFIDPDLSQRHGSIRRWYPVTGKGIGFFTDLWKVATGDELPLGKDGGDMDIDLDELIGKEVVVDVGNRKSEKPGDDRVFNEAVRVVAAA